MFSEGTRRSFVDRQRIELWHQCVNVSTGTSWPSSPGVFIFFLSVFHVLLHLCLIRLVTEKMNKKPK